MKQKSRVKLIDLFKNPLEPHKLYQYAHQLCIWDGNPWQRDENYDVNGEYLEILFENGETRKLYGEAVNCLSPRDRDQEMEKSANRLDFLEKTQEPGIEPYFSDGCADCVDNPRPDCLDVNKDNLSS